MNFVYAEMEWHCVGPYLTPGSISEICNCPSVCNIMARARLLVSRLLNACRLFTGMKSGES